jgi:phenylalanyl-tRNA synthetase alpha subunit
MKNSSKNELVIQLRDEIENLKREIEEEKKSWKVKKEPNNFTITPITPIMKLKRSNCERLDERRY